MNRLLVALTCISTCSVWSGCASTSLPGPFKYVGQGIEAVTELCTGSGSEECLGACQELKGALENSDKGEVGKICQRILDGDGDDIDDAEQYLDAAIAKCAEVQDPINQGELEQAAEDFKKSCLGKVDGEVKGKKEGVAPKQG